ncbi:MAG: tam 2 [Segetibacter sp.]|nr:tam 2 [Segetibacter sp.]
MSRSLKKVLKKVIPLSIRQALKKKSFLISTQDIRETLSLAENSDTRDILQKVNRRVNVNDNMYDAAGGAQYLGIGLSALKYIEIAIAEMNVKPIQKILDLPCGYGRVLRILTRRFPDCQFTACDTEREAVDFCSKEFGAKPLYSQTNLKEFNVGEQYDLIWCGSLATHLDKEGTIELLRFFNRHLASGGLLVFTMHGQFSLGKLRTGEFDYGLPPESVAKIIKDTETTGYGYADYPDTTGYGISVASTDWINARLHEIDKWKDYRFYSTAWANNHDIYALVKE